MHSSVVNVSLVCFCSVYNIVMNLKTSTEPDRSELYELLWEYIHKYKFIRITLRVILQHIMPQSILNCRENRVHKGCGLRISFSENPTRELKTLAAYEKMLYSKLRFFNILINLKSPKSAYEYILYFFKPSTQLLNFNRSKSI